MLAFALVAAVAACGGSEEPEAPTNVAAAAPQEASKVAASGKTEVPVADIPAAVLAAATAARPGFTPTEAETETREGRRYYDVGGTLGDGTEIEFDITEEGGAWKVVEAQRDIPFASAPELVRKAAAEHDAKFAPTRVIESTQSDGIVIFELFGPQGTDPQGRKVEVKWDGKTAEILTKEWAH
jgi:hypothetical protein